VESAGQRHDVIVVGGGLGGMLAAAIVARRGRRVLLLERAARLGGRIRSYDVGEWVVDAGAYLWPDAHLSRALAAAGADGFRQAQVPVEQMMRLYVEGTGGVRFSFPYPGRAASAKALAAAAAALDADAPVYAALCALWEHLAGLDDATVEALRHVPLRTALPHFTADARVAEAFRRNVMLFGSYDPDGASMAECIGLARRDSRRAAAVPAVAGANARGGVRALTAALEAALRAAGVEVRSGWNADAIVIEDGRARGVLASAADDPRQQRFAASAVVSNVPIWQLFDIVAPRHFPEWLVAAARDWQVVGGVVAAAFAFRELPRLRETGEPDRFLGWTRLLTGRQRWFAGGMLWASHHSPHNAPPGHHLLQAMRLSARADLGDAARLQRIIADFESMIDEIYLDARAKLVWSRSWVCRDGSEYMVAAARRPPVQAPGVDGLYLVGETTDVPAVQMDAAALSALLCAEALAG
jgi:phytoene dehydrogenase-like protein